MSEVAGRAFDLLESVAGSKTPMGLMAIAQTTGIDKSTASRLLRFLEGRRFVIRDEETQRYDVGPALMILAATAMSRSDLLVAARLHFPLLRQMTGETVSVHLRVDLERVCLGGLESEQPVRSAVTSGERREVFRGASGKTILAYMPEGDQIRALEMAAQHGTALEPLKAQLREIRLHGGHRGISDRVEGLNAVSAPIFDVNGVVGALTVSGPSHRWTDARMAQCYPQLMSIAQHISAELGNQSSRAASQHDRTSLVANKRLRNEAPTTSA